MDGLAQGGVIGAMVAVVLGAFELVKRVIDKRAAENYKGLPTLGNSTNWSSATSSTKMLLDRLDRHMEQDEKFQRKIHETLLSLIEQSSRTETAMTKMAEAQAQVLTTMAIILDRESRRVS